MRRMGPSRKRRWNAGAQGATGVTPSATGDVGHLSVQGDGRGRVGGGARRVALARLDHAAHVEGERLLRLDRQRRVVVGARPVQLAAFEADKAAAVQVGRRLRLQAQGRVAVVQRLVQVQARAGARPAAQVQRAGLKAVAVVEGEPLVELSYGAVVLIQPEEEGRQPKAQARLLGGRPVRGIDVGQFTLAVAAGGAQAGADQVRLGVVRLELQDGVEILHRQKGLARGDPELRPLAQVGGVLRVQLDGACQVGEGAAVVAPREAGLATTAIARSVLGLVPRRRRRRGGGDSGARWSCPGGAGDGGRGLRRWRHIGLDGQVEHRAAIIGEVSALLTPGHVDVVRQEEVCADQHVGS